MDIAKFKQSIIEQLDENVEKMIKMKIIDFFVANPYPDDDKIHAFAEEMGIDKHKFEAIIYSILSSFLCEGRSKNFKGEYNPQELQMGIEVEMEHTTCPLVSRKIAFDHLAEFNDYYSRLGKMEKDAKEGEDIIGDAMV